MKLGQRLTRLEKAIAPSLNIIDQRQQYAESVAQRRQAAWEYMQPTMSEEHATLVIDAFARGLHDHDHPERHSPAGRLLHCCLRVMHPPTHWPYNEIPREVVFAMPPPVAEVYMEHEVLALHECEDCGYKLPHGYFEACPLCGGRIGWYAYFYRRDAERKRQ